LAKTCAKSKVNFQFCTNFNNLIARQAGTNWVVYAGDEPQQRTVATIAGWQMLPEL